MVDPTVGVAATSGAGCNPSPLDVGWGYAGAGGNFSPNQDPNCNIYVFGGPAGSFYYAYSYYEWFHNSPAPAAYIYRLDEYNASHYASPGTTSTMFQGGLVAYNGQALPGYSLVSYSTKLTDTPIAASTNSFAGLILTFCAGSYGPATSCTPQVQGAPGATNDVAFFQMYATGNGTESATPDIGLGAETLYTSDAVTPTVAVTDATPTALVPNVTDGSVSFTSGDPGGLGIASVTLSGPGITDTSGGTGGLTATNPCLPTYGACASALDNPYSATIHYNTTAATPAGVTTLTLQTTSVSGITATTTSQINVPAPTVIDKGGQQAPEQGYGLARTRRSTRAPAS